MTKFSVAIQLFRNDLRLTDNVILTKAAEFGLILPLYVYDSRQFPVNFLFDKDLEGPNTRWFQFEKSGGFKCRFLVESLKDLENSIMTKGGKLYTCIGKPEDVIPKLVTQLESKGCTVKVFMGKQWTSEETWIEGQLMESLSSKLSLVDGNYTMHHPKDLPFDVNETPMIFTQFRKSVETRGKPVRPLSKPKGSLKFYTESLSDEFQVGIPGLESRKYPFPEGFFPGGESAGLQRLKYYLWDTNLIKSYKDTRNGLQGMDYSSKFSPYLAFGNLSPRHIYHEIKQYESKNGESDGTYWLIFELLWRDYFKFLGQRIGNGLFYWQGCWGNGEKGKFPIPTKQVKKSSKEYQWHGYGNMSQDERLLQAWLNGTTGYPFVDANMRQLKKTGYMSNRGRQNVASFLVHNLKCNWLYGAEWFESILVDYDVESNYGNWQYAAGVGVDPRDRIFNVVKQAKDYDPNGEFVAEWIPELRHVKGTQAIFTPWISDVSYVEGYAKPIVPVDVRMGGGGGNGGGLGRQPEKLQPKQARQSDWKVKKFGRIQ